VQEIGNVRAQGRGRWKVTRTLRYLRFAVLGITAHPRRAPRKRLGYRGPVRNSAYRLWIRSLPSVVSGCWPCEAAHTGSDGGTGIKASDLSCVPLADFEHREYHQIGKVRFALKYGLDFEALVARLNAVYGIGGQA
jgi:hypothetical protein